MIPQTISNKPTGKGRLKAALSLLWVQICIAVLTVGSIIGLDQWTKALALSLKEQPDIIVIPGVMSLTYGENTGAAWGMFKDQPWIFMVFSSVAIVLITYILIRIRKKSDPLLKIILLFFLGGGIGNMIDRIFRRFVVDFIRMDFVKYPALNQETSSFEWQQFPIFNVADSFVTIAAALALLYLIIELYRERMAKKGPEKNESAE